MMFWLYLIRVPYLLGYISKYKWMKLYDSQSLLYSSPGRRTWYKTRLSTVNIVEAGFQISLIFTYIYYVKSSYTWL